MSFPIRKFRRKAAPVAVQGEEPVTDNNKLGAKHCILHVRTGRIEEVLRKEISRRKKEEGFVSDQKVAIEFASKLEAAYYRDELLPRIRSGHITVELQPKYVLIPKFEKGGIKHQAHTYSPDFKVIYPDGSFEVIDVKGMENDRFPLNRKLFDYYVKDAPALIVLKYRKSWGGWITAEEYSKREFEAKKAKKAKEE